MDKEIRDALNDHLKLELAAWYEYAAMALWFERNDLPGFASFMTRQADEELAHARRIIGHLTERDHKAVLPDLARPRDEYGSVKEALETLLEAERRVTASVHALYKLADAREDQAARIMLEWFVSEQVEEENLARGLLGRLRLAGESGPGLLMIDQELAGRGPASAGPGEGEA